MEGLVLEGGKFTINVLGQDNASKVSKQLLKPFKPGEPRLKELETEESKGGGTILKDAVSWRTDLPMTVNCVGSQRFDFCDP